MVTSAASLVAEALQVESQQGDDAVPALSRVSDLPQRLSILVVDADAAAWRSTEAALVRASGDKGQTCDARRAATLADGILALRADGAAIDAILLDAGLPDAAGLEGLSALRAVRPDLPIVILNESPDAHLAGEALRLGAADFLDRAEMEPHTLLRAVRFAIERKKSEAELIRLAHSDSLTGLLNRRAFFDRLTTCLAQSRRTGLACAVIVLDIDDFKEINDVFGHKVGDDFLVAVAEAIRANLRETDAIGRLGGDEFAVVATDLKSPADAMQVAEKIVKAITGMKRLQGVNLDPGVSVGVSVFPFDESRADILVSHADIAMYKSKSGAAGPIHFFDTKLDEETKARHLLKRRMSTDLLNGRFHLVYQPIVEAATHQMVGAEGLARWRGSDGSIILPGEFISIAEETGLIRSLGGQFLEDACRDLKHWGAAGMTSVPISLNISPIQCHDAGFAMLMITTIERLGISPRSIIVEITESAIIKNLQATRRNLDILKNFGVGVHVDDFGTGYSSLSILVDLPLDALKIDRSFVDGIGRRRDAESIIQAVVELSRKLGYKTIAEGVETEVQAEFLRGIGATHLQGFLFSVPVPANDFATRLSTGRSATAQPGGLPAVSQRRPASPNGRQAPGIPAS